MTTVEVLRKARALYEANPSHAGADDCPEEGTVCLMWALDCGAMSLNGAASRVYDAIIAAIGTSALVQWNAEHSTEEVLAAFDRAIEAES